MAEKILQTRIQLKYDTLENWTTNGTVVLKKGEIGLCSVPTGGSLQQVTPPAVLFKVGDGTTAFSALPWASALAADVYAWAKQSQLFVQASGTGVITGVQWNATLNGNKGGLEFTRTNNSSDHTATAGKYISGITQDENGKITAVSEEVLPAESSYTLEMGASGEGYITLKKNGVAVEGAEDIKIVTIGNYLKASDITEGTTNGTIAVNGTDVAVHGLGSAAYTNSDAYATAAQGGKADTAVQSVNGKTGTAITLAKGDIGLGLVENKATDTTVTASSTNYITSGAVKAYVDSVTSGIKQFTYQIVEELPTASASTMGSIYLVAHSHADGPDGSEQPDSYDEYVTIDNEGVYSWETIGNTDIDLTAYAKKTEITAAINNLDGSLTGTFGKDSTITALTETDGIISGTVEKIEITMSQVSDAGSLATKNTITNTEVADGALSQSKIDGLTAALDSKLEEADLADYATDDDVSAAVTAAIGALDKADAAVDGQYVSSVSQTDGKITVARKALPAGALKDLKGNTIFAANQTEDNTIILIDCGSSTEVI